MAQCMEAEMIFRELTSELMNVSGTNFDQRPELQASLFMLGVMCSEPGFEQALTEVAVSSGRTSVTSKQAAKWYESQPAFIEGKEIGYAISNSMSGGRRRKNKQRGGRSSGVKRAIAIAVTVSLIAAGYFGQAELFAQAFNTNTTLTGLQSMLNGFLISKNILYGRCGSMLSVGLRSAGSALTLGNVWSCSQFAAADERTMTTIYGMITSAGFTIETFTGLGREGFLRLVDVVDYILFEAIPALGASTLRNASFAGQKVANYSSRMMSSVQDMVGKAGQGLYSMMSNRNKACPNNQEDAIASVAADLIVSAEEEKEEPQQVSNEEIQMQIRELLGDIVNKVAEDDEENMYDGGARRRRRKTVKKMKHKKRHTKRSNIKKTKKGGKGKKRVTRRR